MDTTNTNGQPAGEGQNSNQQQPAPSAEEQRAEMLKQMADAEATVEGAATFDGEVVIPAPKQAGGQNDAGKGEGGDKGQNPADGQASDQSKAGGKAADDKGKGAADDKGDGKDKPPGQGELTEEQKAVEDEIKSLGLTNPKTQERFRALSAKAQEAETLRPVAARAQEWERLVLSTNASAEQFNTALAVLTAFNSDDPALCEHAFTALTEMTRDMAKRLGKEVQGLHDPLAEHADLAKEVKDGDLSRERALEIANNRNRGKLQDQHAARITTQTSANDAVETAAAACRDLQARLEKEDPEFARKLPFLGPAIQAIRKLPPQQWAAEIEQAYRALPAMPAPGGGGGGQGGGTGGGQRDTAPNALRPSGGGGNNLQAEPTSAVDAINQALAAAGLG